MRGRFFFAVTAMAGLVACPGGDGTAKGSAHLVVERSAPHAARLVDAVARARYCPRDSTLTIIAVGSAWNAVVGMRTAWPPSGTLTVDSALRGIGTAAVAVRSATDSVIPALISRSGKVEIDRGTNIEGHFTVVAGTDSIPATLTGHFAITKRDRAGCPGP